MYAVNADRRGPRSGKRSVCTARTIDAVDPGCPSDLVNADRGIRLKRG